MSAAKSSEKMMSVRKIMIRRTTPKMRMSTEARGRTRMTMMMTVMTTRMRKKGTTRTTTRRAVMTRMRKKIYLTHHLQLSFVCFMHPSVVPLLHCAQCLTLPLGTWMRT